MRPRGGAMTSLIDGIPALCILSMIDPMSAMAD